MLFSFLIALGVSLLVTQVAVFGTTIYLHRAATHRSIVLHPVVAWLFRASLWVTTGIVTDEWVAVHRKHHEERGALEAGLSREALMAIGSSSVTILPERTR